MRISAYWTISATGASLVWDVAASPVSPAGGSQEVSSALLTRDPDAIRNIDKWCEFAEELNTIENAEKTSDRTTVGASVGIFIRQINDRK